MSVDEPTAAETQAARNAVAELLESLDTSDRISLAAVATAAVALVVGIVQTGFMWAARNDERQATLRAEQIRACVGYRLAAVNANEHAQMIAIDGAEPEDARAFDRVLTEYRTAIGQLGYLLPESAGPGLEGVEAETVRAYNAFLDEDFATLAEISSADGAWSQAHNLVLDACERVVRDMRGR